MHNTDHIPQFLQFSFVSSPLSSVLVARFVVMRAAAMLRSALSARPATIIRSATAKAKPQQQPARAFAQVMVKQSIGSEREPMIYPVDSTQVAAAATAASRNSYNTFRTPDLNRAALVCYDAFCALNNSTGLPHDFDSVDQVKAIIKSQLRQAPHSHSICSTDQLNYVAGSGHIGWRDGTAFLSMINSAAGRTGVSSQMVSLLLLHLQQHQPQITSTRLMAYLENSSAVALYSKHGFRVVTTAAHVTGNIRAAAKQAVSAAAAAAGITTRAMTAADVDSCDQLFFTATHCHRKQTITAAAAATDDGEGNAVVAVHNNKIVGYATGAQLAGHMIANDSQFATAAGSADSNTDIVSRLLICALDDTAQQQQLDNSNSDSTIATTPSPTATPIEFYVNSIDSPQLLSWCLSSGYRLNRHSALMVKGSYDRNTSVAYQPSIEW